MSRKKMASTMRLRIFICAEWVLDYLGGIKITSCKVKNRFIDSAVKYDKDHRLNQFDNAKNICLNRDLGGFL